MFTLTHQLVSSSRGHPQVFLRVLDDTAMDLKLQRPAAACHETSEPFAPGDLMYSALVRDASGLVRYDWSAGAWSGPPSETLAWWRSVVPNRPENVVSLAPVDVLLDTLEAIGGQPDELPFRYLLALQLVRRRILRFADVPIESDAVRSGHSMVNGRELETVTFFCRRRDCNYVVNVAHPTAEERTILEEQLASLLWSGGEA